MRQSGQQYYRRLPHWTHYNFSGEYRVRWHCSLLIVSLNVDNNNKIFGKVEMIFHFFLVFRSNVGYFCLEYLCNCEFLLPAYCFCFCFSFSTHKWILSLYFWPRNCVTWSLILLLLLFACHVTVFKLVSVVNHCYYIAHCFIWLWVLLKKKEKSFEKKEKMNAKKILCWSMDFD